MGRALSWSLIVTVAMCSRQTIEISFPELESRDPASIRGDKFAANNFGATTLWSFSVFPFSFSSRARGEKMQTSSGRVFIRKCENVILYNTEIERSGWERSFVNFNETVFRKMQDHRAKCWNVAKPKYSASCRKLVLHPFACFGVEVL